MRADGEEARAAARARAVATGRSPLWDERPCDGTHRAGRLHARASAACDTQALRFMCRRMRAPGRLRERADPSAPAQQRIACADGHPPRTRPPPPMARAPLLVALLLPLAALAARAQPMPPPKASFTGGRVQSGTVYLAECVARAAVLQATLAQAPLCAQPAAFALHGAAMQHRSLLPISSRAAARLPVRAAATRCSSTSRRRRSARTTSGRPWRSSSRRDAVTATRPAFHARWLTRCTRSPWPQLSPAQVLINQVAPSGPAAVTVDFFTLFPNDADAAPFNRTIQGASATGGCAGSPRRAARAHELCQDLPGLLALLAC